MNVFDNALFIFCGTRKDRFKALYWTKSGFLLLYKRFENGYMQWPRDRSEIRRLNYRQMSRLVSGLAIEERRTIQAITPGMCTDTAKRKLFLEIKEKASFSYGRLIYSFQQF